MRVLPGPRRPGRSRPARRRTSTRLASAGPARSARPWTRSDLGDLVADPLDRVERPASGPAGRGRPGAPRSRAQRAVGPRVSRSLAGRAIAGRRSIRAVRRQQAEQRVGRGRLARAGLARRGRRSRPASTSRSTPRTARDGAGPAAVGHPQPAICSRLVPRSAGAVVAGRGRRRPGDVRHARRSSLRQPSRPAPGRGRCGWRRARSATTTRPGSVVSHQAVAR